MHNKYNPQASVTFKSNGSREVSVPYDSSTLPGVVSNDVFNIGDLIIKDQAFVAVQDFPLAYALAPYVFNFFKSHYSQIKQSRFDGVFGLALNDTNSVPSPFYNMITQNVIASPVFSYHISPSSQAGTFSNYVTFGGVDPTAYVGDLSYVPTTGKGRWEVGLSNISLGDNELVLESGTIVTIDTGASWVLLKKNHLGL